MRPPYSSTTAALTTDQRDILLDLAREGHLIALSSFDSEDWRRPGVDEIVRNATPPPR